MKPNDYPRNRQILTDRTEKQKNLIRFRMFNFYKKHGKIVVKLHKIISFEQNKSLEKNLHLLQKKMPEDDFQKHSYKQLNNAFYGTTMENIRNRMKTEFIRNVDTEKLFRKQQNLP